jgi:restriction system protein
MPIPDYETLMLPALRLAARGEVSVRECIERLADEFHLTDDEREQLLPSGKQTRFANRVHWAVTYLAQAGLLERTRRGYARATQRGIGVLKRDLDGIDEKLLAEFPEFKAFKERRHAENEGLSDVSSVTPPALAGSTPEELIDAAYTEITDELRATLLERIANSSPAFFERLIVDLLLEMGYGGSRAEAGQRLGKTGDGGVDGIIKEDFLGLDAVYLQAKRYAPGNVVGVDKVREFAGSLVERGASKGVFVTTSHFAPAAKTYVDRVPQRIVLIDGPELTRLMVRLDVSV